MTTALIPKVPAFTGVYEVVYSETPQVHVGLLQVLSGGRRADVVELTCMTADYRFGKVVQQLRMAACPTCWAMHHRLESKGHEGWCRP